MRVRLYDNSAGADLNYYGEVSIHFLGGGEPLLLSISEGEFARFHYSLQMDYEFVTVESLANQTVMIRSNAIADLYFSSEAYDDYGPEHENYKNHLGNQMPDPRDWEIVEALANDGIGLENFDPADVQRVQERIMITDQQYQELVADGLIKSEDLQKERAKNQERTDLIFRGAQNVTYQLSSGQQRTLYIDSDESLFNELYIFTDLAGGGSANNMIQFETVVFHRIAFINKNAFDYLMAPTHKYHNGRIDSLAADLDR